VSNAIKERSARNSESEVNGNQSVSLSRQGGLITSISAPMFPAFKPLPKVFLSIAFRCFLRRTWRLAFCRFFMEEIGGKLSFHDCTLLLTRQWRAPYLVGCLAEIAVGRPFAS
jgi:hypothetical protein